MKDNEFDMAPVPYQSPDQKAAEKFSQLASLNLNDKTETKNSLAYISWANAWSAMKKVYPTATYSVAKNPQTGLPFFSDPALGIMVYTQVDAGGLKYSMWLPVMDSANKAMKTEAYTYQVWDKAARKYVDKKVEAATMFDINKAIMRCLCKNLAMFGLGLYLYAGEDMPEPSDETSALEEPKPKKRKAQDRYEAISRAISSARTTQELAALYRQHEAEAKGNPQILALFTARKEELLKAA